MTTPSTTIRVAVSQRAELRELAEQRGASMSDTLDAALLALKRELFYKKMAAAEAALRTDPAAWNEFVSERDQWLDAGLESA